MVIYLVLFPVHESHIVWSVMQKSFINAPLLELIKVGEGDVWRQQYNNSFIHTHSYS